MGYAVGGEHQPQRRNSPAGSKDVVIEAFAVVTIVPCGVLHHLGIEAFLADVAHVAFVGHQLEHRGGNHAGEVGKTCVTGVLGELVENRGKLEDKHVDVVVLNRHISPATRVEAEVAEELTLGELKINNEKHDVSIDGQHLELTFKEYELLSLLVLNKGIVLNRDVIMDKIWGINYEGESRTLDMHVKTLRKKLGEYGKRIRTVRNVGYVIE